MTCTAADPWVDTVIRGYADQTSVNRGNSINLKVSSSRPSYRLDVFRMGWYGGTGASLKLSVPSLGAEPGVPTPGRRGLIVANWATSYAPDRRELGERLLPGEAHRQYGEESFIGFVVRDGQQWAFSISPDHHLPGVQQLGRQEPRPTSPRVAAPRISFGRPYESWSGAGMFFDGDYNMIRFIESQGYNEPYATSTDVESNPNVLTGRKVFLSNWHDEYWSKPMRDRITLARNQEAPGVLRREQHLLAESASKARKAARPTA